MSDPIRLVPVRSLASDEVRNKLVELAERAATTNFSGMAVILLQDTGDALTCTYGRGTRLAMLGAVTDLQYTLAKDGDK